MPNHNPATVWTVPEAFQSIYSHATEIRGPGRLLNISGQLGVSTDGRMRPDFVGQLDAAMDNIEALLASANMGVSNLIKTTYFLTRTEDLAALGQVQRRRWASNQPPAVTVLVVAALARPDAMVELEATAFSTE